MNPIPPGAPRPVGVSVVLAKDQPQDTPLPAVIDLNTGIITTEWEFTAAELAAVLAGGRLRLRVWTFLQPLQPLQLEIVE